MLAAPNMFWVLFGSMSIINHDATIIFKLTCKEAMLLFCNACLFNTRQPQVDGWCSQSIFIFVQHHLQFDMLQCAIMVPVLYKVVNKKKEIKLKQNQDWRFLVVMQLCRCIFLAWFEGTHTLRRQSWVDFSYCLMVIIFIFKLLVFYIT